MCGGLFELDGVDGVGPASAAVAFAEAFELAGGGAGLGGYFGFATAPFVLVAAHCLAYGGGCGHLFGWGDAAVAAGQHLGAVEVFSGDCGAGADGAESRAFGLGGATTSSQRWVGGVGWRTHGGRGVVYAFQAREEHFQRRS